MKHGRYLVYVDDVNYHKILPRGDHVAMFAGDGLRIDAWKQWLSAPKVDHSNFPATDGVAVCLVKCSNTTLVFQSGVDIVTDNAHFAGSGSRYAVECWRENGCAKTAVRTAASLDPCTGGEVKFFDSRTGGNNLRPPIPQKQATFAELISALNLKGNIMDLAARTTLPLKLQELSKIAAGVDAPRELAALVAAVEAGSLVPSAPCDAMYSTWTQEKIDEGKRAFLAAFG